MTRDKKEITDRRKGRQQRQLINPVNNCTGYRLK